MEERAAPESPATDGRVRPGAAPLEGEPPGERGPQLGPGAIVFGVVVGAALAAVVTVAAILSFDVNPAGPAIVVAVAVGAGSLTVRRVDDVGLKAAAIGLVVGGVATVLLWPLLSDSSPTLGALLL